MTRPAVTRSQRLPSAPPRISARPHISARLPPLRSIQTSTTLATTAMPAKNQRCQPSWSARKLNAAPVLYASTRLKKPVTGNASPSRNERLDPRLGGEVERRSPRRRASSQRDQPGDGVRERGSRDRSPRRRASGEPARLAGAEEVGHAACAQRRMRCDRRPRRRANASSARTSCSALGVTVDRQRIAAAPRAPPT